MFGYIRVSYHRLRVRGVRGDAGNTAAGDSAR